MFVLAASLFTAAVGFGITLPVLPFFTERLTVNAGGSASDAAWQIGVLTAVYPLAQLVSAPVWGRWSDRVGRRRLVLVGLGGAGAAQVLFGFADSLALLYAARLLGGLFASATVPAAAAHVADTTAAEDRTSRMAWLGTAVSLGAMVGPALGGLLAGASRAGHTVLGGTLITAWAAPFLGAAGVTALAFLMALAWLPESSQAPRAALVAPDATKPAGGALRILLVLGVAAQFGHAMFETTFALYASRMWRYGPTEVELAFMVCGLVMAVAQTGVSGPLARRVGELPLIAAGFALLGASLTILPFLHSTTSVLFVVALLGLGLALVAPTIAALVAARGGARRGAAFGAQSAASSLGQVGGTLVGGALLAWRMEAPYLVAATLMLLIGVAAGAAAVPAIRGWTSSTRLRL